MAALDETLGKAIRAKTAELRDQRARTRWIAAAAASYAFDAAVLVLFAAVGTVSFALSLWYAVGALLISGAFYAAVASGWWLKFALVTRAAPAQGFTLPRVPVRGAR